MARKFLFWITSKGIKGYEIKSKDNIRILKPSGKDIYESTDLKEYYKWFEKAASITSDEVTDLCFVSDSAIELPIEPVEGAKTSWTKEQIKYFCETEFNLSLCEVFYAEDKSFILQRQNVVDKENIPKIYVKCVPELIIEEAEISSDAEQIDEDVDMANVGIVHRYFMEKLQELRGGK